MEWVSHEREGMLHAHLLFDCHLVEFAPPYMKVRLSPNAPKDLPQHLQTLLQKKRGEIWTIAIFDEIGHPTLHEKEQKVREDQRQAILEAPLVNKIMEAFPGAKLVKIEEI